MIDKELLQKAAAEADQAIRDSLPTPQTCEHEFSPAFHKKMHRIFYKAKHPIIYTIPKRVACFIFVAIIVSGTWLTVDAKARAVFFEWVREQFEAFVEYRFIGDAPSGSSVVQYNLTWLPEGFSLEEEEKLGNSTYLTYTDDSGQRIIFSYLQGSDATSLFVASDYVEIESVQIGNIKADFYQASQETAPNGLVWVSEEENLCFCITAPFPKDMMIKLGESVQKNN